VVIALCAVICGADDFVAIAKFGRTKRDWLARFLNLTTGIPSHDRFNAILAAIKPAEFEQCLLSWISTLHEITAGQVIAIDGKTLRRSLACQTDIAQKIVTGGGTYCLAVKGNQPTVHQGIVDSWQACSGLQKI